MLLCTPTGAHVELTGLRFFRKMQRTHDLTVEGVHAYYVLAGTAPLLVHHCDSISMEEAVHRAVAPVGDSDVRGIRSGSFAVQLMSHTTDEAGNLISKIARFDVNPDVPRVQQWGPHLNLETRINKQTVEIGPLKDPHTQIDPARRPSVRTE
ncbi:hypothetical protein ACWGCK_33775 [Streptomyces virginiae]